MPKDLFIFQQFKIRIGKSCIQLLWRIQVLFAIACIPKSVSLACSVKASQQGIAPQLRDVIFETGP
jgi:hypothetical protein